MVTLANKERSLIHRYNLPPAFYPLDFLFLISVKMYFSWIFSHVYCDKPDRGRQGSNLGLEVSRLELRRIFKQRLEVGIE